MTAIKYFFSLLITVCATAEIQAQNIPWGENKLTWSDFKKHIENGNPHHAFTYSGINFEMKVINDTVIIILESYFDPSQSWVHTDHQVDNLLHHEQLHFDITELFCRKMRKEMAPFMNQHISVFVEKQMDKKSKEIFSRLFNEQSSIQQQYDVETRHGIEETEQEKWKSQISRLLNELDS